MIDLHCHILPALDDGAYDLEDSVAMAREAQADGIELICATPHIRHDHAVRIPELGPRVDEVNAALITAQVRVRATTGGEVAATIVDQLDDAELDGVSLGGAYGWILLEPGPGPLGAGLEQAIERLRERGYRSLIAHPERHLAPGVTDRLAALVARGALIQATAAAVTHPRGAPFLRELASLGLVHVVSSDAHSSRQGRSTRIAEALAALCDVKRIAEHMDWIAHEAPRAIVRGEPITPPFPAG